MMHNACRFAGKDQPRLLRTHNPDCPGEGCPGCATCPDRHCQVCHHAHVTVDGRGTDQTCGDCLAETRTALNDIGTYAARMLGEAILRGINSHAAMLAGPTADPEAWGYRRMSAVAGRIDAAFLDDCHDEQHPAWVVGTWEILARDHLHQPRTYDPTLTEARGYLDRQLHHLAHDETFDFRAMHHDLDHCARHLETTLKAGDQIEKGAPCMTCRRNVERVTDDHGRVTYTCRRCRTEVSEAGYMLAVKAEYLEQADRLTTDDMATRTGVPASTIRRWANTRRIAGTDHPPLFRACGTNGQGRKVYRVTDVEHIRDTGGDTRGTTHPTPIADIVSNDGAA